MQGVIYIGSRCPPFARVAPSMMAERLIVAADSGYDNAVAHGVAVDVLIGDDDSIADPHTIPASVQRLRAPRAKDATDTELAIDYCRQVGCRSLLLVGGGGGSVDHLFALLWLFEGARMVERWLLPEATIDCVDGSRSGGGQWRKQIGEAGEIISLLPVGSGPWQLQSSGLRWPLHTVDWQRERVAIRNEAHPPAVTITVRRGRMLIMHDLTAESAAGRAASITIAANKPMVAGKKERKR